MAAAIRVRIGSFTRNYVQLLVSPPHTIKLKQRICFHNSAFLCAVGQELKMPSLSPTMSEGTIVKWLKKEGDPIAPGDVLCDIQTDKAVVSFETEEEGILAKILIKEDQKDIKVGTVIALMVAEGEDWRSVELPKSGDVQSSVPSSSEPVSRSTTGSGVVGQELKMPSLSPTMSEGTIVKWLKKEGDPIAPGDVLCDIQTDKAVVSFETEEEGILARILVQEGAKDIKVGTVIALMVAEGQDWKSVEAPGQGQSSGAPASDAPARPKAGSGAQEIKMPSLSPTMSEGTIVKWMKKEGDTIQPGDVLCDIQTDKAVVSFETEEEGILAKILVPENQPGVTVGTVIALMVAPGENWQNVEVSSEAPSATPTPTPSSPSAPQPSKVVDISQGIFGPAARVLLELHQIQPDQVPASGRKGRLLKEDVQKYIMANSLKPKPPKSVPLPGVMKTAQKLEETKAPPKPKSVTIPANDYIDHELTAVRKTIAKRLTESKATIPHAYGTVDCRIDKLLDLRHKCKEEGIKLSVNDFVLKAVAMALQHVPQVNALYQGDKVIYQNSVDVSVAVATDMGLITPIIKTANAKPLQAISKEVHQLAKKAREGKLQPHEFQGGTFTVSNLGMYGVKEFSAIINPPQCAILAVGTSRSVLDEELNTATKMKITLSYDRRAIDEVLAAQFLVAIKQQLEDPMLMLVGPHEIKEPALDEL